MTPASVPKEPLLLIDDNEQNLRLTKFLLESEGFRVQTAESAEKGLNLMHQLRFSLILLDIQLPGMDGLEFTRRVRQMPEWSRVPIIALTAYAMLGDEERMLGAGCDGYISKPIDTRTFCGTVRSYLAREEKRIACSLAEAPDLPSGMEAKFEDLITEYILERKSEAKELAVMAAEGRFAAIQTIAHNLKGSGGSYGFPELTELGGRLTCAANDCDRAAAEASVVKLQTLLERLDPHRSRLGSISDTVSIDAGK